MKFKFLLKILKSKDFGRYEECEKNFSAFKQLSLTSLFIQYESHMNVNFFFFFF